VKETNKLGLQVDKELWNAVLMLAYEEALGQSYLMPAE